jgi:fucose permease
LTGDRGDRALVLLAFLAFLGLGLPDGVLGVAWPSMRRSFELPMSDLGVLLAAAMIGYLTSSVASGVLVGRLGVGGLLAVSCAAAGASAFLQALAPIWSIVVLAGVVGGLGAGAIDAGLNVFAAARFSPRLTTWLHASYGLGAALGPLLTSAVFAAGGSWRLAYGIVGTTLAGMAVAFGCTGDRWALGSTAAGLPAGPGGSGLASLLRRRPVWLGGLLFFVYSGVEVGVGQWSYSWLVEGRGVSAGAAGGWMALFWASLTVGRVALGAATSRVPPGHLLRASLAAVPAGVLLLGAGWGPGAGALGLPLVGLALGPIFPLLIATTPARVGAPLAPHVIGVQIAAFYLGAAALPGVAGLLVRHTGLETLGPLLLVNALTAAVAYGVAERWGRIDVVASPAVP